MTARAAWAAVVCLWVVAILNYVDRQIVFSLFPVLRTDLHMSDVQLGLVSSAFLLVYGAVSLFAGLLAVKWGLRRTILVSLAIWSAVTLASGALQSGYQLIALRAAMGSSEAFYMPAGLAMVALLHGEATRSRATALHQSGNYVGMVAGGTLGGWFAENWGWRYGFYLLGVVGLLYAGFLAFALRRLAPEGKPSAAANTSVVALGASLTRVPGYGSLLAVFCLFSAAGWIVLTWMPLYLYERFHMGLTEAGFSATFYLNAGAFSGIFLGGWMSDRLRREHPLARIYIPVAGFLCSAVFLFATAAAESRLVVLAGLAMFGFGRGLFDCNILPLLCTLAPPELRAGGYGVFNCGGCLIAAVMTVVAGLLKSTMGLAGSIQVSALGLVVAAWLLWKPIARAVDLSAVRVKV
ncbi:MAG TPA: MFS transporter [Bryobacteraceae bacterium]|nr:MFS transporter [Bryobacteraceae bacterium]